MISGNDVAKFDFRVPNFLNLLEFEDFLDILGIQMLRGPYLLLQVSLCLRHVEHSSAIFENSTLRRDWNFDLPEFFCSCIFFAIVLGQLVKLKFESQQRELKRLMLNK